MRRAIRAAPSSRNTCRGEASSFRQAQQGTVQFGAQSRSSFLVTRHPEDRDRRIAVIGKANYASEAEKRTGISFGIESAQFLLNGHVFNVGKVVDVKPTDMSVADVLRGGQSPTSVRRDERRSAVLAALTPSPQSVREVAKAATALSGVDVSKSTAQRVLDDLYVAGQAERTDQGWTVPLSQSPKTGGTVGHPSSFAQVSMINDDRPCPRCGSLFAMDGTGRGICFNGDCDYEEEAG